MSTFASLVRANARAIITVSRSSVRSLSSRASITRPTLLHQTLPSNAARRWMSDQSRTTELRKVLFFNNIPFNMMEDDIRFELQDFGVITDVYKGTDKMGRPAGWARVEFETEEAAESVMRDHLARPFLFSGRPATIEWAKSQGVAPVRRIRSEPYPSPTLYVGNLSFKASEQDVFNSFSRYGSIKRVAIARSAEGTPRGFAHVEFFALQSAIMAYDDTSSSPIVIQGRPLFLDYQVPPKSYKP